MVIQSWALSSRTWHLPTAVAESAQHLWRVLAFIFIALGFTIRLHLLADPIVGWDEGWSTWLAQQDWRTIALRTAADEHPPLHYWFLNLWLLLSGGGAFALRYASVFFGVLTTALLYRTGLSISGPALGTAAALFLTVSAFHVRWSQEIKMYAPAVFLGLLVLYLMMSWVERPTGRHRLGYVIAAIAALLTHYLLALLVGMVGLAGIARLATQGKWRLVLEWVGMHGAVALFVIPWLLFYLSQAIVFQRRAPLTEAHFAWLTMTVLPLGVSALIEQYRAQALFFTIITGLGMLAFLFQQDAKQRWIGATLVTSLTLPLFSIYLGSRIESAFFHPKMAARYLVLFLPFYALLLANGLVAIWRARRWAGLALSVAGLMLLSGPLNVYLQGRANREDSIAALGRFLTAEHQEGDAVLLLADRNWPVFRFYASGTGSWLLVSETWRDPSDEQLRKLWQTLPYPPRRVWLIRNEGSPLVDPQRRVEAWLGRRLPLVEDVSFGSVAVQRFGASKPPQEAIRSNGAEHPRGTMLSFQSIPSRLTSGDVRYFSTYWSVPVEGQLLRVQLLLSAADGQVVWHEPTGHLLMPGHDAESTTILHALAVSALLPSGYYELSAEVEGIDSVREWPLQIIQIRQQVWQPGTDDLQPTLVVLEGRIALTGVHIRQREVKGAQSVEVGLRWRALTPLARSYKLFLHLVDDDGRIWAQRDDPPAGRRYPTIAWLAGESVYGRYLLRLPPETPQGKLSLVVGLYDPTTGQRLLINEATAVRDGSSAVIGQTTVPFSPRSGD